MPPSGAPSVAAIGATLVAHPVRDRLGHRAAQGRGRRDRDPHLVLRHHGGKPYRIRRCRSRSRRSPAARISIVAISEVRPSWHADGGAGSVAMSVRGRNGRARARQRDDRRGRRDRRTQPRQRHAARRCAAAMQQRRDDDEVQAAHADFYRRNVKTVASVSEDRSCRDVRAFGGSHTHNADPRHSVRQGRHIGRFPAHLGSGDLHVLSRLCDGDHAAFERLAAVSLFDAEHRTLKPGSPVVIETTYGYGRLWAQALGRPLTPEFVDDIDRMFFQTTLDHLTPMGDVKAPARRPCGARAAARPDDQRCRRQHPRADASPRARRACWNSSRPMIRASAPSPRPIPCWRSPSSRTCAPAEIAVVGDTVHDLAAARAAGALAIGVLSGPTDGALLEPLADVLLPSVAELGGAGSTRRFETRAAALQYRAKGLTFGLDGARASAKKSA